MKNKIKNVKILNEKAWHFRNNTKRRNSSKQRGKHPALIVGVSLDGKYMLNIGITHSKKRGRHNNIEIRNPQNWSKTSYLRKDIDLHPKECLREILLNYNLNPNDIMKVEKIIKKRTPTRR